MGITKILYYASYLVLLGILVITRFVIVPGNLQMGLLTAAILFIGAHQSLKLSEIDSVTGKRSTETETISKKDAMMFPVFGSVALFSLYICYKFVGKEYMNLLLTTYIMLAGVAAVANTIEPAFKPIASLECRKKNHKIHFNIPSILQKVLSDQKEVKLDFSNLDIITHAIGLVLAVYFLKTKDFTVHNLFGISFSIQAIRLISIGQFLNAFILLWGLFVYDVFWVFGTDVMVTVALSFEAPAKIIFPQSFEPWKQGILGLGDIVIPGIFVSICLRFDDYINCKKHERNQHRENIQILSLFPRVYFYTCMFGYLAGLAATAFAMHYMKAAQPALLYLVPGTTISVAFVALVRGHLKEMFSYSEDDAHESDKKPIAEEKKKGEKVETKKKK